MDKVVINHEVVTFSHSYNNTIHLVLDFVQEIIHSPLFSFT